MDCVYNAQRCTSLYNYYGCIDSHHFWLHLYLFKHKKNKMKNWKTTLMGLITATIVAITPILETGTIDWKQLGYAALIAIFGYLVKDHNAVL